MSARAPAARPPRGQGRSVARLGAVQALYQIELADAGVEATIAEFARYRLGAEVEGAALAAVDSELFTDLVGGASDRRAEIDTLLEGALDERWRLERLERVVRAMLRAGVYELLARPDVPARVVINEYVDVAHAFFDGGEPAFINGVLDHLARELRRPEIEGGDRDRSSAAG